MRRWRIFCPRCGDSFEDTFPLSAMWKCIDRACRKCHETGVDSVAI